MAKRNLILVSFLALFALTQFSLCGGEENVTNPEKITAADSDKIEKMLGWDGECLIWKYDAVGAQSLYMLEVRRGAVPEAFGDEEVYRLILTVGSDPDKGIRNEILRDVIFDIAEGEVRLLGADYKSAFDKPGFYKYEPAVVFMKPERGESGEPIISANDNWASETERAGVSENHLVTVYNQSEINTPLGPSYNAYEIKHQFGGANTDTYRLAPDDGFIEMTLNIKQPGDAAKRELTLKLSGSPADKCPTAFKDNVPFPPSSGD
ncbi:MAG: hypothetical protein Kow0090_10210 [Myxococcota bacterium]